MTNENPPHEAAGGYSTAAHISISDSPHAQVNLGQQGAVRLTPPQKLASHNAWYWIVHFLIGASAAGIVEILVRGFWGK